VKFRHDVLRALPVITLVCGLLPTPTEAQFSQQGPKLVGIGAVGPAEQGLSVSLSADGNTAIVGGPADDVSTGAAWVFTRSGGVWTQQAKLIGSGGPPTFNAEQGVSVSLSADGNTAILGGNDPIGAAWVFTRSGGVWSQQGPPLTGTGVVGNADQGLSVSLSSDGNTAVIGGPHDDNDTGAAWVFTRSGGVWTQEGLKLVGKDVIGPAELGFSVSVSADGNTAIVGGPIDDTRGCCGPSERSSAGAAWVFTRARGVWTQQGPKLVGTGAVGAEQGYSVSLSGDGTIAILGGPFDDNDTGAAWVFTHSGGVWTQQGLKLIGIGAVGAALQGNSVSLSADGTTAILGGPFDDGTAGAVTAGAAWVFAQPVFAGTPGKSNCHGQSVSALARQYKGLNTAAAALGYADVSALQSAIMVFCGG
jgi:hypothetical protein